MRTVEISQMIETAVTDEERTGNLAAAVERVAKEKGADPGPQAVQGAVMFIREYIEHVPHYLEQGTVAAQEKSLQSQWAHMSRALEAYWMDPNDVIHDHLGLLGVTDDAYASLLFLQSASDHCHATYASGLLHQNLTAANQAIRAFIGEPGASVLDTEVALTLAAAQEVTGRMVDRGFEFAPLDPIWKGADVAELLSAKLGPIGLV